MKDFFERYADRLMWEPNSGCCIWIGAVASEGYGHGYRDGEHFYAHRAALECDIGHELGALDALHSCDFPPCCNPAHLFAGDARTNAADMVRKGRHRPGHLFGEMHGCAKLDKIDVSLIRSSALNGRILAAMFDVSTSQISRIKNGGNWSYG